MQVLDEIKILSDKILEDRHSSKSLLDIFIKDKGKVTEDGVYRRSQVTVKKVLCQMLGWVDFSAHSFCDFSWFYITNIRDLLYI